MILRYVLKNFTRRKVRTILMILALLVSTGLIITMSATVETIRQSNVDIVAGEVGRADIAIEKVDTSRELFIPIEETKALILAADERISGVYARMQIPVEMEYSVGERDSVWMVGLDTATDRIGEVEVREGEYVLGGGRVAVYENTARNTGLDVGDVINIAYAFDLPRVPGRDAITGSSQSRVQQQFTVSAIIRHNGITGGNVSGMLVELSDLQVWLNLPGQAKQLLVAVDPRLYETNNTDVAALQVRDVARAVQLQLGADYRFSLAKASVLSDVAQAFLAFQALINTYGLISLGVVGLLVYTLVLTNVQEQRRDMAVLRILGSRRNLLYRLVIVEVIVIGIIGVGLGIFLGQALTTYVLVPLLTSVLDQEGLTLRLVPTVSPTAIVPPVISAFTVLILSSLKPAQEASRTKVMHAINPAVADNIQLEDLEQLRERRSNGKLFLAGIVLMMIFAMLTGFEALAEFGGPAIQVVFVLLSFFMLVIGLTLVFFITTVPFERLVIAVMRLISPRLTYFADRNVSRGQARNTLISLLVLFSGVLPSFLGTNVELERANMETNIQMSYGAPVKIESFGFRNPGQLAFGEQTASYLKPSFLRNELASVSGIDQSVGISYGFDTSVQDRVGLRRAGVSVIGLDGDYTEVTFNDLMEFTAGGPESLQAILTDPNAVIISEGLADHLAVGLGSVVELRGEGLDHIDKARVVGIARRIPGFSEIGRSRISARGNSTVLVSMDHFRRLITPLDRVQPGPNDPLIQTILATMQPDANWGDVAEEINERFAEENAFWTDTVEGRLEESRGETTFFITFLLALTGISFTTAVFAVFAVIYVTIYARRIEIGMLKSMGMLRRELTGMLIVEAIAMTLGAALAGIAAGASMGYLTYYLDALTAQRPVVFAVDTIVMPAIIIMVVFASVLAAAFSARRIVRKQAVEILRMS